MDEIKWEAPPSDSRSAKREKYQEVAAALRERPNEWALLTDDASGGVTTRIKKGDFAAFRPAGAFDATARPGGGNRFKIWVRYVGEPGSRSA